MAPGQLPLSGRDGARSEEPGGAPRLGGTAGHLGVTPGHRLDIAWTAWATWTVGGRWSTGGARKSPEGAWKKRGSRGSCGGSEAQERR
ncbi:hypothetical protein NDU88_006913 [Pleurodeles waltl]|uniref:Uncharacterized protein n=1 Tax=Pleurodeles waltl TaxID=8319 RepID=A0AAV7UMF9_PLEWA|nr:hypothetical protein NDU88_006913 [Pleurodeles waltl]